MAGSKPLSAAEVSPSPVVRRFTLEQTNQALTYVRRVVADLVRVHAQVQTLQASVDAASDARQQAAIQRELTERTVRLGELSHELTDAGVEVRDFKIGQVGFVGRHKGRDVYLVWTLGEDRVEHWHEVNAAYGARQPVASLQESE